MTEFSPLISEQEKSKLFPFFTNFYKAADTPPTENDPYLTFFGKGAKINLNHDELQSIEEFKVLREGPWKVSKTSKHTVEKVSKFDDGKFFAKGVVKLVLINDKELEVNFGAYYEFNDDLTQLKYYQGSFDTSGIAKAFA